MTFSDYRIALVTGASSGIGLAVAETLARNGLEVHALARNAERLHELAGRTGCIPHALDVTDTAALARLLQHLDVDVLVNNAGVNRAGSILDADADAVEELVTVNLGAVLHLVRLVMPGMIARDRGHIVNISSIGGVHTFAANTVYQATKAAVHHLTPHLRLEGRGSRVRVTEICPGRVETEMAGRQLGDFAEANRRFFEGYEALQPVDVAAAIEFAVGAPRHINISFLRSCPRSRCLEA